MKPVKVPPTPDRTDRGVIHQSPHPDQAKQLAQQARQHAADLARIEKLANRGQKK